jgi:hypothetical protein
MNSANSDTTNLKDLKLDGEVIKGETKHPNIKYHHLNEEVRKETISTTQEISNR